MTWLLVHSPLVGPSTWRPLANLLVTEGEQAIVAGLRPAPPRA